MMQEKYTRVMRDKAELTDKADQLEHLVVQLQGETDTIGKSLYLSFLILSLAVFLSFFLSVFLFVSLVVSLSLVCCISLSIYLCDICLSVTFFLSSLAFSLSLALLSVCLSYPLSLSVRTTSANGMN